MDQALALARADANSRWRAMLDAALAGATDARMRFKTSLTDRHPAERAIWSHDDMLCTLVRVIVEPDEQTDEEPLPLFNVRFDDGIQITAFEEELIDADGRFAPMYDIVSRGFAAARDLG